MLVYPALFTQGEKYITVTFPDIPEAITQGKDLQEAYEMATEVLGFALEDYSEYPAPSDLTTVQESSTGATVALVSVDMVAYMQKYHSKTIRKNVTIPEWLNILAEEKNINFSQTLQEALQAKLQA